MGSSQLGSLALEHRMNKNAISSRTKVSVWSVDELVGAVTNEPSREKWIVIPPFQRSIVWKDDQRKSFIDSVKRGYPIGSLLLYTIGTDESRRHSLYSLVDGLQRTTSLVDYQGHPTKYFQPNDITAEITSDIAVSLGLEAAAEQISSIQAFILSWLESRPGFEEIDKYSGYHLGVALDDYYSTNGMQDRDFIDRLGIFLTGLRNQAKISDVNIPVLIYGGDRSTLSNIFERLNNAGTVLSKYQVFAATWSDEAVSISDDAIIEAIKSRYNKLEKLGYQIEGIDTELLDKSSRFSLFDFLFGFGKKLSDAYPILFGSKEDGANGFLVATVCAGLRINEMAELAAKIRKRKIDINVFESKIISAIEFVSQQLSPILTLEAIGGPSGRLHAEYQIVSIIGRVFFRRYDENFQEQSEWNKLSKLYATTIPQHYLFDIISEQWRGSGDSKLGDLVFDSNAYESTISRRTWEAAFEQMFSGQMEKTTRQRQPVDKATMLFLKYIYAHMISVHSNQSTTYELEHLIPIARLKASVENYNQPLPMSAAGNVALLREDLNRRKGDRTITEYIRSQEDAGTITHDNAESVLADYLDFTIVTNSEALVIPGEEGSPDIPPPDWYLKFVKARFDKLKARFYRDYRIAD